MSIIHWRVLRAVVAALSAALLLLLRWLLLLLLLPLLLSAVACLPACLPARHLAPCSLAPRALLMRARPAHCGFVSLFDYTAWGVWISVALVRVYRSWKMLVKHSVDMWPSWGQVALLTLPWL